MSYCFKCESFYCRCEKEKQENLCMLIKKPEHFELPEIELPKPIWQTTNKPELVKATCPACMGSGIDPWNRICFDCNGSGYDLVRKEDVYWGRRNKI